MRRVSGELLGRSPEEHERHHKSITNPIKGTRAVNHTGNLKPEDSGTGHRVKHSADVCVLRVSEYKCRPERK